MAFDSGFLAASLCEIREKCGGCHVEKIYQPRADQVDLIFRAKGGPARLVLRCGTGDSRVGLSSLASDNPQVPPNFCMLLRKHLLGSVLSEARQEGFERVAVFAFACRDELGYDCERRLIAEITGRNSNLIFTDGDGKILGALRTVDFSTSRLRQVLPGMRYEMPPAQEGRRDPSAETAEGFEEGLRAAPPEKTAAAYVNSAYFGICPALAREIVFLACRNASALCSEASGRLGEVFVSVMKRIAERDFSPSVAFSEGRPVEFSFIPLTQYGPGAAKCFSSPGEALDAFYAERDRETMVSARAADLRRAVSGATARIARKLNIQSRELEECEQADACRAEAELIVANLYKIKKGDREALLTDYSSPLPDGGFAERRVVLDPRTHPSEYAQRLFKKYSKLKTRRVELARQRLNGEAELEYLSTVADALSRAETGADLSGIREELERGGYLSARRESSRAGRVKNSPAEYVTSGGFTLLCGRNNYQNDEITFRLSEPGDIWFHAKGVPGSHLVLR
ncbi:MAG: NFACT family protein, partial [Clostridia bacterium]|nr:NFACT family protein [Clostridia bacterium]